MRFAHLLFLALGVFSSLDMPLAATTLKLNKHRTDSAFLSTNMRRRFGARYNPVVSRHAPGSQGIITRRWYPPIPNRHRRGGDKKKNGFTYVGVHPRWDTGQVVDHSVTLSKSGDYSASISSSLFDTTSDPSSLSVSLPTTSVTSEASAFSVWQSSSTRFAAAVDLTSTTSGSAPADSASSTSGAGAASGSQVSGAASGSQTSGSAPFVPSGSQTSGSIVSAPTSAASGGIASAPGSTVSGSTVFSGPISASGSVASTASTESQPKASPSDSSLPIKANSIAYFVDLVISAGRVSVPVMVDTGSSALWLAGTHCTTCTDAKMKGAVVIPDGCQSIDPINYGTGTVQGCITSTTLQVGGYELVNYPTIGATQIDSVMARFGDFISGIWGLGTHEGNVDRAPTPIDQMYANNQITVPEVGFYLVRDEDPEDSQIVIGDPAKVMGTGAGSLPIDGTKKVVLPDKDPSSGHYVVGLEGITIFGHALGTNVNVIVDTGATLINVPPEFLDPIYAFMGNGTIYQDKATNQYILPCNMAAPEDEVLSFKFGGMDFGMKFKDLISMGPVKDHTDFCPGSIVPTAASGLWLIGDAFLVNVFHSVNVQTGELTMYGLKS